MSYIRLPACDLRVSPGQYSIHRIARGGNNFVLQYLQEEEEERVETCRMRLLGLRPRLMDQILPLVVIPVSSPFQCLVH